MPKGEQGFPPPKPQKRKESADDFALEARAAYDYEQSLKPASTQRAEKMDEKLPGGAVDTDEKGYASIPREDSKDGSPIEATVGESRQQLKGAVEELINYQTDAPEEFNPQTFEDVRPGDMSAYTGDAPADNRGVEHWTNPDPADVIRQHTAANKAATAADFEQIRKDALEKFDAASKKAIDESFGTKEEPAKAGVRTSTEPYTVPTYEQMKGPGKVARMKNMLDRARKEGLDQSLERMREYFADRSRELGDNIKGLGVRMFDDVKSLGLGTLRGAGYVAMHPVESAKTAYRSGERAWAYLTKEDDTWGHKLERFGGDAKVLIEKYNGLPPRQKVAVAVALAVGSGLTGGVLSGILAGGMYAQRSVGIAGFGLNRLKNVDAKMASGDHLLSNAPEWAKSTYKYTYAGILTGIYGATTVIGVNRIAEAVSHWMGYDLGVSAPRGPGAGSHHPQGTHPHEAAPKGARVAAEKPLVSAHAEHAQAPLKSAQTSEVPDIRPTPKPHFEAYRAYHASESALSAGKLSELREQFETKYLNTWQLDHPGTMPDASSIQASVDAQVRDYLAAHHTSAMGAGAAHHATEAPASVHEAQPLPESRMETAPPAVETPPPSAEPAPSLNLQPETTPADQAPQSFESGANNNLPPLEDRGFVGEYPNPPGAESIPPDYGTHQPGGLHARDARLEPGMESSAAAHGVDVRSFAAAHMNEPHFYGDASGKDVIVFGGTPQQQADAMLNYLRSPGNGDKVIYGTDLRGAYRIPYRLGPDGNIMTLGPARSGGLFGFFSSWLSAPKAEDLKSLIK